MGRTVKKPRLVCAWCGSKIRHGKAITHRGRHYCDISCGGAHPRGRRPEKKEVEDGAE